MYANINVVFFLQKNKVSLLRPVTVKTALLLRPPLLIVVHEVGLFK